MQVSHATCKNSSKFHTRTTCVSCPKLTALSCPNVLIVLRSLQTQFETICLHIYYYTNHVNCYIMIFMMIYFHLHAIQKTF